MAATTADAVAKDQVLNLFDSITSRTVSDDGFVLEVVVLEKVHV